MTDRNKTIGNILEDIGERLYDYIRFRVPNIDDAEDVLQDVLYQFTDSFDTIVSVERSLGWLYTVSKNKIADLFRKRGRASLDDDIEIQAVIDEISSDPEDEFEMQFLNDEIVNAINNLPQKQKEVFIKHEIEGKSFKQISDDNGESINTLLARKRYAIQSLRKQLKQTYQEILEQ